MLPTYELGQTIAELADIFKRLSPEGRHCRLLAHLNMTGLQLLEDPFPGQRKFYGWIICHPQNRVGEKEIYSFLGMQKGRPDLPSFVLTSVGFTLAAKSLARKWGIELITFSTWAEYILAGRIMTPGTGEKYDIDFLA